MVSCFLHKQEQASPGKESFYLKLRIPLCKPCYIKYIKAPYGEYFNWYLYFLISQFGFLQYSTPRIFDLCFYKLFYKSRATFSFRLLPLFTFMKTFFFIILFSFSMIKIFSWIFIFIFCCALFIFLKLCQLNIHFFPIDRIKSSKNLRILRNFHLSMYPLTLQYVFDMLAKWWS